MSFIWRNRFDKCEVFIEKTTLFRPYKTRASSPHSAFTRTGIDVPVCNWYGQWPRTLSIPAMAPPWLVNDIHVLSSWLKMSSNKTFILESSSSSVSLWSGFHSSSSSANPFSNVHKGKWSWRYVLLLLRSQVCTPFVSRSSSLTFGTKRWGDDDDDNDKVENVTFAVERHL